jgi:hypothetical protein
MIAWGRCLMSACALGVVLTPVSPSLAQSGGADAQSGVARTRAALGGRSKLGALCAGVRVHHHERRCVEANRVPGLALDRGGERVQPLQHHCVLEIGALDSTDAGIDVTLRSPASCRDAGRCHSLRRRRERHGAAGRASRSTRPDEHRRANSVCRLGRRCDVCRPDDCVRRRAGRHRMALSIG